MPERTCVGCRQKGEQAALVRLALVNGTIEIGRTLLGRGAYVHGREECLRRAVEKGELVRAFRSAVEAPNLENLLKAVKEDQYT